MTTSGTNMPVLSESRVIVPLTAGICLIMLVMVLKNILLVPAAQLSSDLLLYIVMYTGIIIMVPLTGRSDTGTPAQTLLWTGVIIVATLAIIAVYAL